MGIFADLKKSMVGLFVVKRGFSPKGGLYMNISYCRMDSDDCDGGLLRWADYRTENGAMIKGETGSISRR